LVFMAEGAPNASYEIHAVADGRHRLLGRETSGVSVVRQAITLPAATERLEFRTDGSLRLVDLRITRPVFLWPLYTIGAAVLIIVEVRCPPRHIGRGAEWLVLPASVLLCLFVTEVALRLLATRLPPAIVAARAEYGLAGEDPRLIDPHRYRVRLRPNLDTYLQWRFGDIVRLGFVPPDLAPGKVHRFPLRTDTEGFRNDFVRGNIDVAALGDSFTDATTGPAEESWPSRLAQHTGRAVQNYGTSGFGPQQELYVLRDFVLPRARRTVVLAFSAGNDLSDAEAFAQWERERTGSDERADGS
ncbi:MAG TPA: hypothetical protein VK993_07005, partial [Chthoniobacterales bacterium]|nr:hypothetical protein [Chthoniobacterales bacterium]